VDCGVAGLHTGVVTLSLRLGIVESALEEAMALLEELPVSEVTKALAARAVDLDLELTDWQWEPPGEERRREMVTSAMNLVVEVMAVRRARGGATAAGEPVVVRTSDSERASMRRVARAGHSTPPPP
jgi:hypothetical protein